MYKNFDLPPFPLFPRWTPLSATINLSGSVAYNGRCSGVENQYLHMQGLEFFYSGMTGS